MTNPKSNLKRIVMPTLTYDNRRWWHRGGIAGKKEDGQIWGRITSEPKQWDGYFILVDMDVKGGPIDEAPENKNIGATEPEAGPGPDEVPF